MKETAMLIQKNIENCSLNEIKDVFACMANKLEDAAGEINWYKAELEKNEDYLKKLEIANLELDSENERFKRALEYVSQLTSENPQRIQAIVDAALSQKENNMELKIVCEDEKYMPTYANNTDACMDLKIKTKQTVEVDGHDANIDTYFLSPQETKVFSTGIKVSIPQDHVMMIFPRSSTGFKLQCMLSNTTGIIDAGYRDEIKLALTNFGKETVCLKDGQRIAQFVVIPRPKVALVPVEDNEDFRNGDRGGGIGSTGK